MTWKLYVLILANGIAWASLLGRISESSDLDAVAGVVAGFLVIVACIREAQKEVYDNTQ
jgi:hypothetical protein